ncbi:hypothetical protein EV138_5947 [Kribbella voronezhensis]|uniref:Uncharacterized protein n=1 Tax=Kribbella voronezhensis TaxID=2512212 RepID=A0A4V3FIR6_9ACTN|nr:hypothetical protein [Kribbella voronezhensis]TDU83483.1 hypothetical protein EV138_5947 [Kribbella voronezhensis]
MTRQIPAERPLPHKTVILDRVLADHDEKRGRKAWLLPVTAAASIAVIATGALTVPSMLKSDPGPAPAGKGGGASSAATTKPKAAENTVSVDRGQLTATQAKAFATECIKWVGSHDVPGQTYETAPLDWPGMGAKIGKIRHATKVADSDRSTDWTVAVDSGGSTYACVGTITTKDPDGRVRRNYDFGTFSRKYPDGLGGTGDNLGSIGKPDGTLTGFPSSRWVTVAPGVTTVQRRMVMKGKPGPWFTTDVVDGLAYIRSWSSATLRLGDKAQVETRRLDKDGNLVGPVVIDRRVVVKGLSGDGYTTLSSAG